MTKTNQKIPEGWSVKRLGEIFFKSQTKNIEAKNIPVLTNSAVKGVIPQNEYFDREIISEENLCNYYYVECGDFIYNPRISKTAPAGPIKRNHFTKPGCVSPLYTVFKIASDVSEEFYENYFESNLWAYEAYKVANYGARSDRMNITDRDFFNIKLPFPPLAEQKKIAEILSCWDEGIEKLSALIEKKKLQKKALMQQLLIAKIRLPAFTDPWKNVKLGNFLIFQTGFPFDSQFFNQDGDGIRLIKNRDLKSDDQMYFYSGNYSTDDIVNDGDILVGMDGDFLPCLWKKGRALLNQRVGRVICNKNLNHIFAYYALSSPLEKIQNKTASTTVKHLSHAGVLEIKTIIPSSLAEQKAIAEILSKADEEIELLNKKLEAFKLEKKALMQKLLTGQIRVKVN